MSPFLFYLFSVKAYVYPPCESKLNMEIKV